MQRGGQEVELEPWRWLKRGFQVGREPLGRVGVDDEDLPSAFRSARKSHEDIKVLK